MDKPSRSCEKQRTKYRTPEDTILPPGLILLTDHFQRRAREKEPTLQNILDFNENISICLGFV